MEDGAVLGDIDLVAAEHRVDLGAEADLVGELEEQFEGVGGDSVLGVVEKQPGALGGEAFAPLGIIGEEGAEVLAPNRTEMCVERLPGGAVGERGLR